MEKGEVKEMFSEEEVREISGLKRMDDCVMVTCGCTSRRYGDAVGCLKLYPTGDLHISCDCTPGCLEDKLSPVAFVQHSERETAGKWKNNIWVIVDGQKVPLYKTPLLKYYDKSLKSVNGSQKRSQTGRVCHRDEFVRCTKCNKERRFRLRNKDECRIYHDTLAYKNWECADGSHVSINCEDDEERASRRAYRGCLSSPTCPGCTSCVCFGCHICRFTDCSCQTCTDFTSNVKN